MKTCYIYRLFATGTLEEKQLQRQLNKSNLANMVMNGGGRSTDEDGNGNGKSVVGFAKE